VNVEAALRASDALGGHFVLGHVDGVGSIAALTPAGTGATLKVTADRSLTQHMVPRGSVAVDGVSLTVAEPAADGFTCALIPTTLEDTVLGSKRPGDRVNIETDILAKLVARYLEKLPGSGGGLSAEKLRDAGFA
jgi:riboflavin synthase